MKKFLRNFVVAGAGFALLELVTRPRPRVELTDAGAAAFASLVLLDAELRGDLDDGAAARDGSPRAGRDASRRLCLCDGCSARRSVLRA